jgi:hypothetical protein
MALFNYGQMLLKPAYESFLITVPADDSMRMLLKGWVGKKIAVMTVEPLSANSSTELTSMISESRVFSAPAIRGATCLPAKSF